MNKTLERIQLKADLMVLSKRERDMLGELSELRARIREIHSDVRATRWRKAEIIRVLFFRHRVTQTAIGHFAKLRQGNVSRIISQQVYSGPNYYREPA